MCLCWLCCLVCSCCLLSLMSCVVICFALSCLRGGALGHVMVFVIAVRTVICFFVCVGWCACFACDCLFCVMGFVVVCFVL